MPSIARARASRRPAGDFPTAALGEICGWTVDDVRAGLWMNLWTRSWTKSLVATQARADDAQVASEEGAHGVAEERVAGLGIEFIAFCFPRRSVGWPRLYDEMCYAARDRLFQGL